MDIVSVQENISIIQTAGSGESGKEGVISGFSWSGGNTSAVISLSHIGTNYYYKITFTGGEYGIKDENDNYLEEDKKYIFYIQ